jgi:hypothetical protein
MNCRTVRTSCGSSRDTDELSMHCQLHVNYLSKILRALHGHIPPLNPCHNRAGSGAVAQLGMWCAGC